MAQLPVMPLYTDALLGDTLHLSYAEFGAYMLLLTAMWRAGGSLQNDDTILRRIARVPANNWPRVRDAVLPLLVVEGDRITQKRLAAEFQKTAEQKARRAAAGSKGGSARAWNLLPHGEAEVLAGREGSVLPLETSHKDAKSLKTLKAFQAMLQPGLKQTASPAEASISISIDKEEREAIASPKKEGSGQAKPNRGTRLAEDWKPSAGDWAYATGKGCSPGRIEREAESFRNFWLAKAGEGGVKRDWSATWRNWIINALDRRPEPKAYTGSSGGWSLPAWGAGGPRR